MDDLRIQVINYRTKQYLIGCLASVIDDLRSSPVTFKIAVMDNASGDDLSDIKSLFPDAPISIFENQKNVGFGAGHNLLEKKADAGARYLLILNPDIKIQEKSTLTRLLKRADELPADVIGPRLITATHEAQRWDHAELYGLLAQIALSAGGSHWKNRRTLSEVAWISGAFFIVRKDFFDKIGGFDENFFLYKEEEDLCLRIRKTAGHVWYDPTVTVLHYGSVVAKKSEYLQKSTAYFLEKNFRGHFGYHFLQFLNKLIR